MDELDFSCCEYVCFIKVIKVMRKAGAPSVLVI